MRALSFGEILFDIIEGEDFLGGAPLNFAAHLAKCGAESYILSRVGDDELGKKALEQIEELNIKDIFIQRDSNYLTGTVEVELKGGQPDYTILENVAYDFISTEDVDEKLNKEEFDIFYFGTLAQRSRDSAKTLHHLLDKKSFKHVFYDINLRKGYFSKKILEGSLQRCTILKLNDEEVDVLSNLFFGEKIIMEKFAERIAEDFKIHLVIITAGARGCLVHEKGKFGFEKGFPAEVVDTVGAGDAFSAAFIFQYYKYGDALKAARIANRLGAYVASSRGPIPAYSAEIKSILGIS